MKRLEKILSLIEPCNVLADIGTDHGFLPVYLAQTQSVSHIIATDISESSLNAAKLSADRYGVANAITFHVASGLDRIAYKDVDTVVITGMGGETILGILRDAPWTRHPDVNLILQPQTKIDVLCRFLYDNGYIIRNIRSVSDRGKHYSIILAGGGGKPG